MSTDNVDASTWNNNDDNDALSLSDALLKHMHTKSNPIHSKFPAQEHRMEKNHVCVSCLHSHIDGMLLSRSILLKSHITCNIH